MSGKYFYINIEVKTCKDRNTYKWIGREKLELKIMKVQQKCYEMLRMTFNNGLGD